MSELEYTISLTLGDWSDDGHGKTEVFVIKSNLTSTEIDDAYERGTKILGFDLSKDAAAEYEDSTISDTNVQILAANGFDITLMLKTTEGNYYLDYETFLDVWLHAVYLGNKDFLWEVMDRKQMQNLNIGGYGLFY